MLATILHCKCVVTGPGFGKVISFGTMCNSPVFLNFWYDAGFLFIMISAVIFLVCLASVSVHFYACTLDAFLACTQNFPLSLNMVTFLNVQRYHCCMFLMSNLLCACCFHISLVQASSQRYVYFVFSVGHRGGRSRRNRIRSGWLCCSYQSSSVRTQGFSYCFNLSVNATFTAIFQFDTVNIRFCFVKCSFIQWMKHVSCNKSSEQFRCNAAIKCDII